jgi:hypothetical protein
MMEAQQEREDQTMTILYQWANAEVNKKMYLDGIPNRKDSPVTKYLKDRNKTTISADDVEIKID